ncbi:hypothetical protein KCP75_11765 [Salmonella enterica subsp. enterica]|nr:hypothetical protein KCP75_11765 [Salmonella enterica subsp. enterica]
MGNRVRHMVTAYQSTNFDVYPLARRAATYAVRSVRCAGLYDAFFADGDEFERLYVKYENGGIRKQRVKSGRTLFSL